LNSKLTAHSFPVSSLCFWHWSFFAQSHFQLYNDTLSQT